MSKFLPFAEIEAAYLDEETGEVVVRTKAGEPIFSTTVYPSMASIQRLVDCWNACRMLYSPANHINETDEYVKRLETLRKEAWARVEAQDSNSPSDDRVNPRRTGGDVANAGGGDVDGSASRADRAGQTSYALAGQVETQTKAKFVDDPASGPDVKRAPLSLGDIWSTDLSHAPRDGSPVILALNGKTFKSYWCKPQIDPPHWCFLSHKQTPEAWMPWPEFKGHAEAPAMEAAE